MKPRYSKRVREEAALIFSVSQRQAEWLRSARDTEGGVYVGSTAGGEVFDLVNGGAATYREVRQCSGTRSVHDQSPCEWTDFYLVPTEHGLGMLAEYESRNCTARSSRETP